VVLEHSIEETVATLDSCDRRAYRSLLEPLTGQFDQLIAEVLSPMWHLPRHRLLLARFGPLALLSGRRLAKFFFRGERARAFFASMTTHSILSLEQPTSAAVALVLMAAGHARGWPILRGGAQSLSDILARHLHNLGGDIETEHEVTSLPETDLVLADLTPRQLVRIAGSSLPPSFQKRLERFQYGAGAFKIDYALNAPIPWRARECSRNATVHLGGSFEEIVASERTFSSDTPFVLLGQPSLFDSSRAPGDQHTAWAYCHVPNGSTKDVTNLIERQITRFAPEVSRLHIVEMCLASRKSRTLESESGGG
jgi:phytoene dehydrogenase-like protein